MSIFFKFMFERLTDPLGLPINALYEYIILAVIGAVLSAAERKARSSIGLSDLFSLWVCGFSHTVLFRDTSL